MPPICSHPTRVRITLGLLGTALLGFSSLAPAAKMLPMPSTDADFPAPNAPREELGKLLFFDKILSGNQNTSCATCHHTLTATGDGLSLSVGEGGRGLGITRDTGSGAEAVVERVPRNAPHVFNLGARQFETMFHDGRVQADPDHPGEFLTPAGDQFPQGIIDNALAAQAMFPVTSATEMAGQDNENAIASAAAAGRLAGPDGVWELLARRLRAIPEYVDRFMTAFDDIQSAEDIRFAHAAQAIGRFEAAAWRCDNSRFDQYLAGFGDALSRQEKLGMHLFYGAAGCSRCHSGTFQTDHRFHAIAMPQIGPGKGDNQDGYDDGHDDFGRERVTGDPLDRFKFRTPSLRMVAQTGPWGHDGAYNSLEDVVRHHLNPARAIFAYDTASAALPSRPDLDALDFVVQDDPVRLKAIAAAAEIRRIDLAPEELEDLIAFLHSLTDGSCTDLRMDTPSAVPSGLTLTE